MKKTTRPSFLHRAFSVLAALALFPAVAQAVNITVSNVYIDRKGAGATTNAVFTTDETITFYVQTSYPLNDSVDESGYNPNLKFNFRLDVAGTEVRSASWAGSTTLSGNPNTLVFTYPVQSGDQSASNALYAVTGPLFSVPDPDTIVAIVGEDTPAVDNLATVTWSGASNPLKDTDGSSLVTVNPLVPFDGSITTTDIRVDKGWDIDPDTGVGRYRAGQPVYIYVQTSPELDPTTLPPGFKLNFRLYKSVSTTYARSADYITKNENGLVFQYTVREEDETRSNALYPSGQLYTYTGYPAPYNGVKTAAGQTVESGRNVSFLNWTNVNNPLSDPVAFNPAAKLKVIGYEFDRTGTFTTGQSIGIYVKTDPMLDEETIDLDDFTFNFRFSDTLGTPSKNGVRKAKCYGIHETPSGEEGLYFVYDVQEIDYSAGDLFPTAEAPLFGSRDYPNQFKDIRTIDGDKVKELLLFNVETPDVPILVNGTDTTTEIIVNPNNAKFLQIHFQDLNRGDPNNNYYFDKDASYPLSEGDESIKYVVDIGRAPTSPVTVTLDWGVANVFGASQTVTFEFTSTSPSCVTGTIDRILDNGLGVQLTHKYDNITAYRSDDPEQEHKAKMKAVVSNVDPSFYNLGTPDALFWTTTNPTPAYVAGTTITNTVYFQDAAFEQLDEPYKVEWFYGGTLATNTTIVRTGDHWTSQSSGRLLEGSTVVSVTIYDKNGGHISTNLTFVVPQTPESPRLYADPASVNENELGLTGIGDGIIHIYDPTDPSPTPQELLWVRKYGTLMPYDRYGNHAIVEADPATASAETSFFDSFPYRWIDNGVGESSSAGEATLIKGGDPISATATVQLWRRITTTTAGASMNYECTHPVLTYYFSQEFYRPDNFGDIDADGLGDRWELNKFGKSSESNGETDTLPSETATGVYGSAGNMDADGLPVNCFGESVKFEVREDKSLYHDPGVTTDPFKLKKGVYNVSVFRYPLDSSDVKRFGYIPLGRDSDNDKDSPEIEAFEANAYVDQNAKSQIKRVMVNFSNVLEFRGVGEFQNVWDGVEPVSFRPVGDGDDPNTDPTTSDTDSDGLPDGWEYYFWATAYYNVNPDQWLRFNGAAPDVAKSTFQGTGTPITRDEILAAFRPNGGGSRTADIDNDGLSNYEEYLLGTNPIHWDTDGDGMPDGWEVDFGLASGTEKIISEDENGEPVVTEVDVSTVILNPLKPDGNNNVDGDFFAYYVDPSTGRVLKHFDVYEAFDFDPRTGWCDPDLNSVTYAGNTFRSISFANTAKFTAREEFDLAAWYVAHGVVSSVVPFDPKEENNDGKPFNWWGFWATDPGSPDTDADGIPDGWEAYVGNPASALRISPKNDKDAGLDNEQLEGGLHGDALSNLQEFLCTTATNVYAYLREPDEKHGNHDYLPDIEAWANKPWPTNPNASMGIGYADGCDTDGDQVLDGYEKGPNANPTCVDTDHDWLPDGWECAFGTDPLVRDTYLDYDGDGLQNWQEYLSGAVWPWQYDKWYDMARLPASENGFGPQGPAYGAVDMFDFFISPGDRDTFREKYGRYDHGGFGRHPHPWDVAFGARSRAVGVPETTYPFYFLVAEPRGGSSPCLVPAAGMSMHGLSDLGEPRMDTGFNETIVNRQVGAAAAAGTEPRWTYSQYGFVRFATTDPWNPDSDYDGMSDYYETYHGLNPLYGGVMGSSHDLVNKTDDYFNPVMNPYPSAPWDLVSYPWLAGDPEADPDKDGLSSGEEAVNVAVEGGSHHTDPSPLWITDPSYERSFVNLYYRPGLAMDDPMYPLWYFGFGSGGVRRPPRYAFSFEANEGYDTDNDNIGDRSEVTLDELEAKADPLDFDKPRRRKALYFNGVDAAARTRGGYVAGNLDKHDQGTARIADSYAREIARYREAFDDLRTFTVEAWIRPEDPVSGHDQTIIERGAIVDQDTAKGDITGKRLNFRLSLTPTGAVRGEFHNYQGAHVTLETDAKASGLRAGVWSHVAMTYSGRPSQTGSLTIFINGISHASTPSSLQAFNGVLPIHEDEFSSQVTGYNDVYWFTHNTVRTVACPIVIGASDAAPNNEVNGHVAYNNREYIASDDGPALHDFFKGWIDEVRIWDGAAAPESIRSRMYKRFDRLSIADNHINSKDAVSGNDVKIRYHYTFDNLPDVVSVADRTPDRPIRPYDVETLPMGFEEVFTAPVDGSYPGVPWWSTAPLHGYHYDTRHIPWIENTVAHLATGTVEDDPRVLAVRNQTTGDIVGWRVDYTDYVHEDGRIAMVNNLVGYNSSTNSGFSAIAANLPDTADPYGVTYTTVLYGTNHLVYATNDLVYVKDGKTYAINDDGTPVEFTFPGYALDEGSLAFPNDHDVLDWSSDLLPLGGAVADYDIELWDGLGIGYNVATIDSDGDGMPDWWETLYGLDPFDHTDAWDDLDHDDLDNLAEYLVGWRQKPDGTWMWGTNPLMIDTDGNGMSDYYARDNGKSLTYGELYDDGDQMPSWWEYIHGLNPRRDDAAEDPDGDGWSNYSEYLVGTDPRAASDHPNPPVVFNVDYAGDADGNALSGDLYVFAYSDPEMQGRPNAVWMQNLHPQDNGYLQIDNDWCATVRQGKWTYSGSLAVANVANDGALMFDFYTEGMRPLKEFAVGNTMVVAENVSEATWFECTQCQKMYSRAQMTVGPGGSVRSCPRGHVGVGSVIVPYLGTSEELRCGDELWGTIDHMTGTWTITIPNVRDAREKLVGTTLVATYNALPNPVFPFQMRQKWTNMKSGAKEIQSTRNDGDVENSSTTHAHEGSQNANSGSDQTGKWIVADGHLREGENRFFAFLDQNENSVYDVGEPAGMAVYQPVGVDPGAVVVTIPLTDALTGYPRFGWTPADVGKYGQQFGAEYFISIKSGSATVLTMQPVSSRPFFMENDLASIHGLNLGQRPYYDYTWFVYTNRNDAATNYYASGAGSIEIWNSTNNVEHVTRRAFSILTPTVGSVVSDPSLVATWAMDWRNEGVVVTLKNTDNNQTYVNGTIVNHPQRIGATYDNDYYFTIEPQKVLGGGKFIDIPDGHYTLTLAEYIQSTGLSPQNTPIKKSASVNFIIDRTGTIAPNNPGADLLGSVNGTITYYGKIPFTVTDETVATYDGQTSLLSGTLSHSPVPGTVTVRVVNGATTNVVATDAGAFEGFTTQGLVSQPPSTVNGTPQPLVVIGNSYVTYGDAPAVSLELDAAPAAGSRLVVSYKQYDCPIRIQAFSTSGASFHDAAADQRRLDGNERASFSGAPVTQKTVYNKGAFTLEGLPWGTYYIRAFIDQDRDRVLDNWESVGYAMTVLRSDYGMDNFQAIEVGPGASHVEIVIKDRDTDTDQLPDAWEYYYFGGISGQGGFTQKKAGVLLRQEYADGELDSNPLVEDTDGDGLPDVIEHQIGSNNHAWDSDGDGIGDLEEFLAGSDPTDASSKARFAAPAPGFDEDGTPVIVLQTPYLAPGTYLQYELLVKGSLADSEWETVGRSEKVGVDKKSPVGLPAGTVTISDPDGKGFDASFYKVKALFESDTLLDE